MAIEIRAPRDEELRDVLVTLEAAFGGGLENEERELASTRKTMPLDRVLAAFDDGRIVGTAAAWPFRITIPGGELPCPGVTWVGVLPSHRRRGLATALMRRQLDDVHARGEPLAGLWASEGPIYGRFGYGQAAPLHMLDATAPDFALRDDPGLAGRIRIVTLEEAREQLPPIYDRVRPTRPGMLSRSPEWWSEERLSDRWDRPGAGPRFHAVLELDGADEGYAIYKVEQKGDRGIPDGAVRVVEALATSTRATQELWRFLFSIDLTSVVDARLLDPAAPLFWSVADPRRLRLRYTDGLWLRLVDVDAALRARSWAGGDSVVLEVRDAFCPWNAGRHRAGGDAGRADGETPDLALDVADLASLYLGGVDAVLLHASGRIEERTPGAVERAAALFRTPLPPFCPEVF
ncbi:MAG TPA: GNAT family N-acetyltransferase [Gaiellaceae bacterium]|nr:GNAT family N-acetyltransferase [Gaiellaceae bacterium]